MNTRTSRLVFFTVLWSFLRSGKPWLLVPFLRDKIVFSIRASLNARPLAVLKFLRIIPGLLGIAILAVTFGYLPFELSLIGLLQIGLLCIASSCLVLSAAALLLAPSLLSAFWRTWLRFNVHTIVFFVIIVPVLSISDSNRGGFSGQVTLLLVFWLLSHRVVDYLIDCLIWQRRHRVKGMDIGHDRFEVSDTEYWKYCVHEGGHLLMYGLLSRLPEDAFAVVDRSPQYGFGGYVALLHQMSGTGTTVALMEWLTMTYYAGAAAEEIEFGSHCEGGKSDFAAAETTIRRLAGMLPGQSYFPSPDNDVERSINAETICILRKKYFDDALIVLRENRTILQAIAEHLQKNASMDCEEFHPLWSRVKLPASFMFVAPPDGVACLDKPRVTQNDGQSS